MKDINIEYLFRLTCASCIPRLRTSWSELSWALVYEHGFLVGMVMVEPVGYPLRYSSNMLLGLAP